MNDPEQTDIPCYPRQVGAQRAPYVFRFFRFLPGHKQDPRPRQSQQPRWQRHLTAHDTKRKHRTKREMALPDIGKARAHPLLTILLLCTVLMGTVLFGTDYKEESVSIGKYKKKE